MNEFPEEQFAPPSHLVGEYTDRVEHGRRTMKYHFAVIGGLVRQAGARLGDALEMMERIGQLFRDYQLVIYENDSTDGTVAGLIEWASSRPNRRAICAITGQPLWPSVRDPERGRQMAEYREQLRDQMIDSARDADFAIVMDTDLAAYSLDGLANSFGHDDWDAMGSLGLKRHPSGRLINYDVWAWRSDRHPEPHHWARINPLVWPRGREPVKVWSCFGGMMAYRMDAFRSARYAGDGGGDHYRFHFGMREAGFGRIFCNPSQLTLYN